MKRLLVPGVVVIALCMAVLCMAVGGVRAEGTAGADDPSRGFPEHPFMLWTKDDLTAIRNRIATQPWAKKAYEALLVSNDKLEEPLRNLLQYALDGDERAGDIERKKLMKFVDAPHPLGGANEFNALRYDILYDSLSQGQREAVEKKFHEYLAYSVIGNGVLEKDKFPGLFNDKKDPPFSRYDKNPRTRSNWLPNIIFPRQLSANLMAVALRDRGLVKQVWERPGISIKWYLDEYLGDSGFYEEEFTKMGATPGALLLYCLAVQHAGMNELGFGYTGKGGASVKGHLFTPILIAYPKVDLGTARPQIPRLTIGDIRSPMDEFPPYAFQQNLVTGFLPDGTGGNEHWRAHGAWGGETRGNSDQWDNEKTPKMQVRYWYEIAQKQWPDAGFDYFLAQMRGPKEDKFYPSLFFGLDPIDPAEAEKHKPAAPSAVYKDRGVAMLRAEESPAYWDSAAPAVGLRLAAPYAHAVNDSFTISGFVANNRPLYVNRHINPSYAAGWSRSVESHAGVVVGFSPAEREAEAAKDEKGRQRHREPQFDANVETRTHFSPAAKYLSMRSDGTASGTVYKGVDFTRSYVLTREYLVDVTRLRSPEPRTYHWLAHAIGWGTLEGSQPGALPADLSEFSNFKSAPVGKGAKVVVSQGQAREGSRPRLPQAWYDRNVGVTLHMPAARGLTAGVADTPLAERMPPADDEFGGTSIILTQASEAEPVFFTVVHEPTERGKGRIREVRAYGTDGKMAALTVHGDTFTDAIVLPFAGVDRASMGSDGLEVGGAGFSFVRVTRDRVDIAGQADRVSLAVTGSPKVFANGKEVQATVANGLLTWKK